MEIGGSRWVYRRMNRREDTERQPVQEAGSRPRGVAAVQEKVQNSSSSPREQSRQQSQVTSNPVIKQQFHT